MGGTYCKEITLLFKRDLLTGGKEFVGAFTSLKAAKIYRKNHFYKELMAATERWGVLFPIERHRVLYQEDLL